MRHYIKIIVLFSALTVTLSACNATGSQALTPLPEKTAQPVSTPGPEPVFPVDMHTVTKELNDDDRKIYITTVMPDGSKYVPGALGYIAAGDIMTDTTEFKNMILQAAEDYPAMDENYIRYGLNTIMEVTCNGPEYLNILVDYYTFTGGAHGNIIRNSYVYSEDGIRIEDFTCLLVDSYGPGDVENEINSQMAANIEENGYMYFSDSISFSDFPELPQFYIKDGLVIIYFQTYDIAAYAAGIQEFTMPAKLFTIPNF